MTAPWFLLADVGGTNARFAVADARSGDISNIETLSVADHPTFSSALRAFLASVEQVSDWDRLPEQACLAVACPPDSDVITFTNSAWVVDRQDLGDILELDSLTVINDFEAQGYAVLSLRDEDWVQIGEGNAEPSKPIGVLGPGTGLGVCSAVPRGDGHFVVVPGEGGHVDFAPVDDLEIDILRLLLKRYSRVSSERLLSGAGLVNIDWALRQIRGVESREFTPAQLSEAALSGSDAIARESVEVFCRVLGSVAGNLALTQGAAGGIYIAGGILPRILKLAQNSGFRDRFLAKGRFKEYLSGIPTRVIVRNNTGLIGANHLLQSRRSL